MGRNKEYLLCIISVIIGAAIFITVGIGKRITFCDEVYTYMIVNSSDAALQLVESQWYTRNQVVDMLGHTENDSVIQMLRNVRGDSHPPLYYGLVYILSLISGGSLSKWVALSLNAFMYMGTIVFLWMILYRLFKKPAAASASALVYALNVGALSDAMLLRMYMQLTFFTIVSAYLTLLLYENKDELKYYIFLGIATAAGFLTQFYFCFVAIGFFIVWLVYNMAVKVYRRIFKYLGAMAGAVLFDTLVWRYWINTILFNSDSETIKENALDFANIFISFFKGMEIVQLSLFQRWYIAGGILSALVVLAALFSKKVSALHENIKLYIGTIAVALTSYAGAVCYLTPSYLISTRYFYAAAALELLLLAVCVNALLQAYTAHAGRAGGNIKSAAAVFCIAADVFILVLGYGIDYYTDADEYDGQRAVLEQYSGIPWLICGDENWRITANFFDYTIPEQLMRVTKDSAYRNEPILENTDSFIIVAYEDGDDQLEGDTGLYYYIGCTEKFAASRLLMERNGLSYYLAYPVE